MKTSLRYLITLSVVLILALPNLSLAVSRVNNKKFYGTYTGSIKGANCTEPVYFVVGDEIADVGKASYLYLPLTETSLTYEGVDENSDPFTNTIIVKGKKLNYSKVKSEWEGHVTFKFSKTYKKGTITGNITSSNPDDCQGQITGSFKNVFAGTYKITLQGNDNIKDGVSIYTSRRTVKVTQNGADKLTVTSGKFSFPLVQSGNMATLSTHPYDMGAYNQLEFLLLSDGNNMVSAISGQEGYDLTDISWSVANWLRTSKLVTIDDYVGTWNVNLYSDPNLGNTGDGFDPANETITISKVNSNKITVDIDGNTLSLDVSKNRATITNPPITFGSTTYQAFSIVTDGTGLSLYLVADPTFTDSTDVSVTIGLGTKQ